MKRKRLGVLGQLSKRTRHFKSLGNPKLIV